MLLHINGKFTRLVLFKSVGYSWKENRNNHILCGFVSLKSYNGLFVTEIFGPRCNCIGVIVRYNLNSFILKIHRNIRSHFFIIRYVGVLETTFVIKFVSDLRQVGGFLRVIRFPPSIKLTATIKLKYC
jgi:hypothetical protein